jgi:FkbM family methyltransferase
MNLDEIAYHCRNYDGLRYSDIKQDIMVLSVTKRKKNGFFVEFGAMAGQKHSNTYLLESEFGWDGIVAEPAKVFHAELMKNRKCAIDLRAVDKVSNRVLKFKQTDIQLGLSGLISYFDPEEYHARTRANSDGSVYDVKTVCLNDLLAEHNAPKTIDYVSVDTEGSEPAILESFDFDKWNVRIWTVEHNYFEKARNVVHKIMTGNGYKRILPELSTIDDWYVRNTDGL